MLPISKTSEAISEFPSVRSKQARTISIKQYLEIISSERYRLRVEKYRQSVPADFLIRRNRV